MDKIRETYFEYYSMEKVADELGISRETVRRHLTKEDKEKSILKTMKEKALCLLYITEKDFELYVDGTIYKSKKVLESVINKKKVNIYTWRLEKVKENKWIQFDSFERNYRKDLTAAKLNGITFINFRPYTNKAAIIEDLGMEEDGVMAMKAYIDFWNSKTNGKFLQKHTLSAAMDYNFYHNFFNESELNYLSQSARKLLPEPHLYHSLLKTNFGGYIETNHCYEILRNVKSYDLKSAYEANFIRRQFPISKFILTNEEPDKLLKQNKAFFIHFRTNKQIEIITKELQIDTDYYMSDVLYRELRNQNILKEFEVIELWKSEYGYLDDMFRLRSIEIYNKKEELKEASPIESLACKFTLQNKYGKSIQNIFINSESEKQDWGKIIARYQDRYLLPQWGVWSHDYTFAIILNIVGELKKSNIDIVACDTDCIRFIDNECRGEEIINKFNEELGLGFSLGLFSLEGIRDYYCGRRSKSYCYIQDEKVVIKQAGIDRIKMQEWIKTKTPVDILDIYSNPAPLPIGDEYRCRMFL